VVNSIHSVSAHKTIVCVICDVTILANSKYQYLKKGTMGGPDNYQTAELHLGSRYITLGIILIYLFSGEFLCFYSIQV
jgi:hypothetical protein